MKDDPYTRAIEIVCRYYNITRLECVEYYWDEVEEIMSITWELLYSEKTR